MNSGRRNTLVAAAVAGIIGPVAFAAAVVIHAAIRPDYSHVTSVVSALAARDRLAGFKTRTSLGSDYC